MDDSYNSMNNSVHLGEIDGIPPNLFHLYHPSVPQCYLMLLIEMITDTIDRLPGRRQGREGAGLMLITHQIRGLTRPPVQEPRASQPSFPRKGSKVEIPIPTRRLQDSLPPAPPHPIQMVSPSAGQLALTLS